MAALTVTERRARYAAGATAGAVVGGGLAAGTSIALARLVSNLSRTSTAQSIARTATRAAPGLVRALPVVGTVAAVGLTAYGLYGTLAPVIARAQERRREDAIDRTFKQIDGNLARAERGLVYVDRLALEQRLQGMSKDELKAYQARVGIKADGIYGSKTMQAAYKFESTSGDKPASSAPQSAPAAIPPPPTWWDNVKDTFKESPEITAERARLQRQAEETRRRMNAEFDGTSGSKSKGAGPNYDKLKREADEADQKLKDFNKESRETNPFRQGFETFAPIAASLGGIFIGSGALSGAKKIAGRAEDVGREVGKLGAQAGKVLKSRPNSLIVGTPAGDRGKAIVNEAYAHGGARPAFPSPGYPGANMPASQVFARTGTPRVGDYLVPTMNLTLGSAALVTSLYDPNENRRMAERIAGGFEVGLAAGQFKSLATMAAIRPAASAVSAIEGLRTRLAREMATGAPAGVAASRGAANLALARGQARMAQIGVEGQVAGARMRAKLPAINAGAQVGVAKERGAGEVAKAVKTRARYGQGAVYKNTWQDKLGRTYHRKDFSVRKPAAGANDNTRSSRSKAN